MHNALFDALGINAAYLPYAPEPDDLGFAVEGFRAMKFRGANVTIPYKTQIGKYLDEISPLSQLCNSVNTLYWKDGIVGGTLCGTTTDPYGCINNLIEHGVNLRGKHIAILGNGGAAMALALSLSKIANEITIVCRSKKRANPLINNLNSLMNYLFLKDGIPFKQIYLRTFDEFYLYSDEIDIIINATSIGMVPFENISPLQYYDLNEKHVVMDIVYTPPHTKLLQMAEAKGCKIVTGEGMLVHQGLESFKKWFPKETENKTNEELTAIMRKGMQG